MLHLLEADFGKGIVVSPHGRHLQPECPFQKLCSKASNCGLILEMKKAYCASAELLQRLPRPFNEQADDALISSTISKALKCSEVMKG